MEPVDIEKAVFAKLEGRDALHCIFFLSNVIIGMITYLYFSKQIPEEAVKLIIK
ncbi:MAG: hypothetical protein WC677_07590 [Clostridia bacterium]|jgi:hypothetical protein